MAIYVIEIWKFLQAMHVLRLSISSVQSFLRRSVGILFLITCRNIYEIDTEKDSGRNFEIKCRNLSECLAESSMYQLYSILLAQTGARTHNLSHRRKLQWMGRLLRANIIDDIYTCIYLVLNFEVFLEQDLYRVVDEYK